MRATILIGVDSRDICDIRYSGAHHEPIIVNILRILIGVR